jgi:CPA1 family monovalent cation:H+ antiporter
MLEKSTPSAHALGIISILAVVASERASRFPSCSSSPAGDWPFPDFRVRLDPEIVFLIFLPPLLFQRHGIFRGKISAQFPSDLCSCRWDLSLPDRLRRIRSLLADSGMTLATGIRAGGDCFASRHRRRGRLAIFGSPSGSPQCSKARASSMMRAVWWLPVRRRGGGHRFVSLIDAAADFVWGCPWEARSSAAGWDRCRLLHRHLRDPSVVVTLTPLTPYLSYLPAERLGFSGVLAVVTTGLYIGHRAWEALGPESRLQREHLEAAGLSPEWDRLHSHRSAVSLHSSEMKIR